MTENPGGTPQPTRLAADNQTYLEIRSGREPLPEPKGIAPARRSAAGPGGGPPEAAEYALQGGIGTGGMGDIVSALHRPTNREVALKFALPREGMDEEERVRLLWEAQAVAGLEHPGIIPVHDIGFLDSGEADGEPPRPFYAMRKMPQGRTWGQYRCALSMPENLEILQRVCDAVAFAHSRNVIHRDIKPDNVMLGDYGEVFVLDWGLAASWGPSAERLDSARPLTFDDGGSIGSPSYAAPEQIRRDRSAIGVATDVYLLGATLFELIAESPPHGESGTGDDLSAILQNARENHIVEGDVRDEHRGLLEIAKKAMASKPSDRYLDVKEFQAALRIWDAARQGYELLRLGRAEQDRAVEKAKELGCVPADIYTLFDKAARLYASARDLLPDPQKAEQAEFGLGFDYAGHALAAGDLDVAKAKLPDPRLDEPDSPEHAALRKKVTEALRRRTSRERRIKLLTWGLGSTAALAVLVFWIMSRSVRNTTLRHAESAFQSGAAIRDFGAPGTFGHAQARFREAAELFAKAGVKNHAVALALWDALPWNLDPVKSSTLLGEDAGILPAFPRELLGPPWDGSISLPPYAFSVSEEELLTVHPSSGNPEAIVLRNSSSETLIEMRALDPQADFIRRRIIRPPVAHPPGSREHIVGAAYRDSGKALEVALQDGRRLLFRSDNDKALRLPMVEKRGANPGMIPPEALPGVPASLTASTDGRFLAASLTDGRVAVVDAIAWKTIGVVPGVEKSTTPAEAVFLSQKLLPLPDVAAGGMTPVAFVPGTGGFVAPFGDKIAMWLSADGRLNWTVPTSPATPLALGFSRKDELVAFTAEAVFVFRDNEWMRTVAMPPPADWLALPYPYAVAPTGDRVLRMVAHPDVAAAASPWADGRFALEMWDAAKGERLWSLDGVAASAIAWNGDGTKFALYDMSRGVTTINAAVTGKALETLRNRQAEVANSDIPAGIVSIAFSPNSESLALVDSINRFMLWDKKENLLALTWPWESYQEFLSSDRPSQPAQPLFLRSNVLILSDVSGTMTRHLFNSSLLLNAKAPFGEAGSPDVVKDPGVKLDYRKFEGGVLVRIDFPE